MRPRPVDRYPATTPLVSSDGFSAESRVIHAGTDRAPGSAVTPPLVPTSIFVSADEPGPPDAYGRSSNPTWAALEEALGTLEDARAVTFASGMAAALALSLSLTEDRARIMLPRIVLPVDGYYNTQILAQRLRPFGAETVLVDLLDLEQVERELRRTPCLLWAETPSNPLLRVADLAALGQLAAVADAPMVVDNTVATGFLQKPLELGATASVYSLTKSAAGHSDLLLGAVVSRDEQLLGRVRQWRSLGGAIPGTFEAWLALRGLKTLPLRVKAQSESALAVARHLETHPRVRTVHYPGLTPATLELARRQMPVGFGPLLSFELDGSKSHAEAVVRASRLVLPTTSFGGVESSWERRARWPSESAPESLIRLSVGIEPVSDLLADIEASLSTAR